MATNDFVPVATAGGADVMSQAAWVALAQRLTGFTTGVMFSDQFNKALRQSSFMASLVGEFMTLYQSGNVLDDGVMATKLAQLQAALRLYISNVQGVQGWTGLTVESRTTYVVSIQAEDINFSSVSLGLQTVHNFAANIDSRTSGLNGLDVGAIAANTWYNVYAIYNPTTDTEAGILSLAAPSPSGLPAGFTHYRRVATFRTSSTPDIFLPYAKRGNDVTLIVNSSYKMPLLASGVQGNINTPTYVTVDLSDATPVDQGYAAAVKYVVWVEDDNGVLLCPSTLYGDQQDSTNPPFLNPYSGDGLGNAWGSLLVPVTFGQTNVFYASSDANAKLYATGWVE